MSGRVRAFARHSGTARRLMLCGAFALSALVLTLSACGSGSDAPATGAQLVPSAEALVDAHGKPISRAVLDRWSKVERAAGARFGAEALRAALALQLMGIWTTGEAVELGASASERQAEAQLSAYEDDRTVGSAYAPVAREGAFVHLLATPNLSHADAVWLMRTNMLRVGIERAQRRRAEEHIPRAAIARYYAAHKRRFLIPRRIHMEILGSHEEAVVAKAKREIEKGADFLKVAKRVSIDTEAPEGLQDFFKGQEEPPFESIVFAANAGVLTGPEKYQLYYLFRVTKFTPARQRSLTESEPAIRRQIANAHHTQSEAILRRLDHRWAATTRCTSPQTARVCEELRAQAR
jgi:PPIC-type PPIASE domain